MTRNPAHPNALPKLEPLKDTPSIVKEKPFRRPVAAKLASVSTPAASSLPQNSGADGRPAAARRIKFWSLILGGSTAGVATVAWVGAVSPSPFASGASALAANFLSPSMSRPGS
jgi:hypothetical protein